MWFKKRKGNVIKVIRKGWGLTPETGFDLYYHNEFVKCFRNLQELNDYICHVKFYELVEDL